VSALSHRGLVSLAACLGVIAGLVLVREVAAQRRERPELSLPRFSGHVSDRNYAAACNCSSYDAGLT
jgi:hypothetical protein